ncbi:hypothetical protein [Acinetobacter sp. ANC 5045]|uniref:hypothetical protein n=1 Tax=Acinetobacter sp. ANC 5045 TaxID=2529851 RepID=UPI00103E2540|nr:hypothetical protein [Acinetobacter sp. ANC 5045]TCB20419.1 hypothetical protein E0H79_03765 [Acinetobacter sp. ANC 5045]
MDFKNKLGTVDAHNLNLNFKPDNTDSHNIILNFEHLADGSTNLNFGDDVTAVIDTVLDAEFSFEVTAVYADSGANTAVIDTVLDTEFSFEVVAVFKDNIDVIGQIDTVLDTSFSFEIVAEFAENLCTIDTVLDTAFQFEIDAVFDINHIVGVSYAFDASYQKAIAALSVTAIPWAKPILRVSNEALFYDQGLVLSQQAMAGFDRSNSLAQAVRIEHEKATGLQTDTYLVWQTGDKRFIHQSYLFDETLKLRINRITDWHEMIRKRRTVTYAHEVANVFEKHFTFEWDKGLELVTTDDLAWEKAKAIHYRKHPVKPWPQPELPQYEGTGDLNFICLCNEVDAHNVILNFGVDDCIPAIPNQNWWYILNSLSVTRLDNDADILVYDGNYRTDRSSWAWSYSLTVPHTEIAKLEPINGQPVILKIMVNGHEHHMLLENRTRSRNFGNITYTLTGRSQTALLDAPYAPLRSFLQENERTSVQLAQAELDRVFSDTVLNWQLIDDLGWIVANNSLSYSNLAPIAAIKLIAESGGGFIYSEKGSNTLSIKPLYKKTFWDTFTVDDYDRLVPDSLVTSQSTDYELYPDYNGITLTNDRTGKQAQVKRTGTAADVLLPPENNPLFDVVSMGAFGKSKLAKAGMIETHTLTMPISAEVSECAPGEVLAFSAEWWGIVESVSVSFSHAKVNQTVKVERVNRE